jgi:hypothetical protein
VVVAADSQYTAKSRQLATDSLARKFSAPRQ